MPRGLQIALGLLRIAAGISLLGPGFAKLGWFTHPTLEETLANWAQHAPNGLVVSYLHLVAPHHATLARLVVIGELGLGSLLVLGFFTPVAAVLAFIMVAQYHFASGAMFQGSYIFGQNGLVYLLIFPVLVAGRAGVALGFDGIVGRSLGAASRTV
ncbi:MAG TPA: DoxX family membrane protein [Myxococcales bacterium]|nr:DoxX family membrane protein [Myxococcales bacterium]